MTVFVGCSNQAMQARTHFGDLVQLDATPLALASDFAHLSDGDMRCKGPIITTANTCTYKQALVILKCPIWASR